MARIIVSIAMLICLTINLGYGLPVREIESDSQVDDRRKYNVIQLDETSNSDEVIVPNNVYNSVIVHKIVKRTPRDCGVLCVLGCPIGKHRSAGGQCVKDTPDYDNEEPPEE